MDKHWYVIHTYSGYENKVKADLEKRIESMNMENYIFRVMVPTEDVVEKKNNKEKINKRKVFPGYVLVEMVMTDDSWYVVRNTTGVTGFVGTGAKPVPLYAVSYTHLDVYKRQTAARCRRAFMALARRARFPAAKWPKCVGSMALLMNKKGSSIKKRCV